MCHQTWRLIGWQYSRQAIRSHVTKLWLTNMDFNMDLMSNRGPRYFAHGSRLVVFCCALLQVNYTQIFPQRTWRNNNAIITSKRLFATSSWRNNDLLRHVSGLLKTMHNKSECLFHDSDFTWELWRLISRTTRLFVQPFIQTNIKVIAMYYGDR